ncbi:MAG: tol-pal system protein YbgF [Phenylobacterium sp.]|nr:MAG: tol-pal system protein YbgF [Phenylobacterium sp.]
MGRLAPTAALGLLILAAPVMGLGAAPARAQTPIDESLSKRDAKRLDDMEKVVRELRAIVFKARDTGKPVTVEEGDTDARLAELATKISDLEQSLTRVNGGLETTAHDLDQARRDNAALQAQAKTFSDRLAAIEQKLAAAETAAAAAPAPTVVAPTAEAAAPPPQGSPTEAFANARQLMLAGQYDAAEGAFRDYVQTYPDAPRTPEARYWWGKTLSVKAAHADAATAYIGAIRGWPATSWGPDAVVELARELVALKKPEDACQTLAELPKHYPKAPAAVKARATETSVRAKCG